MADISFVKYRSLIEKWEQIALGDLLDDQFNEPLLVSKALHAFQVRIIYSDSNYD